MFAKTFIIAQVFVKTHHKVANMVLMYEVKKTLHRCATLNTTLPRVVRKIAVWANIVGCNG